MILEADGGRPVGRVLESGEEDDMFWYIVEYRAPSAIRGTGGAETRSWWTSIPNSGTSSR